MKKVNSKQTKCFILVLFMLVTLAIPVQAEEETEDANPFRMVTTAGSSGYYSFDLNTDEVDYVLPSEYQPEGTSGNSSLELSDFSDINSPENGSGSISPNAVIGSSDNRIKITDASLSQYRNTCLIVTRFKNNEKAYGTGFIIDDYHVLTAGHLVYRRINEIIGESAEDFTEDERWADHLAVYAGSSGGDWEKYSLAHYARVGGDYVDYCDTETEYTQQGAFDDWAIIRCDTSMASVGHMEIDPANSMSDMNGGTYYLQGYPRDKNEIEFGENDDLNNLTDYYMYRTSGSIIMDVPNFNPRFLDLVYIDLDTDEGMSGGPVYYRSGGTNYAQAIYVCENDEFDYNCAILINDWLYSLIQNDL